jgi:hypothetical protein
MSRCSNTPRFEKLLYLDYNYHTQLEKVGIMSSFVEVPISKEEFINMYNSMSNRQISLCLGISPYKITKIAKSLNLKKKAGRPFNQYIFETD